MPPPLFLTCKFTPRGPSIFFSSSCEEASTRYAASKPTTSTNRALAAMRLMHGGRWSDCDHWSDNCVESKYLNVEPIVGGCHGPVARSAICDQRSVITVPGARWHRQCLQTGLKTWLHAKQNICTKWFGGRRQSVAYRHIQHKRFTSNHKKTFMQMWVIRWPLPYPHAVWSSPKMFRNCFRARNIFVTVVLNVVIVVVVQCLPP